MVKNAEALREQFEKKKQQINFKANAILLKTQRDTQIYRQTDRESLGSPSTVAAVKLLLYGKQFVCAFRKSSFH